MIRAKLGSVLFVGGMVVLLAAPSSEGEAMAGPTGDGDGPAKKEVNVAAGAAAVAQNAGAALVNAGLKPAATETERQKVRWEARAQKELGDVNRWHELTKGYPFGRLATVDEIASTIVFLASARASYIRGTIVTVDGGRSYRDK